MDHQEENVDDTSHVVQPLQTTSSCYALLRDALRNSDQLTAMISNYSTSYNAVNVGIVLPILQYSLDVAKNNTDEPYTSPRQFEITSVQSTFLSVVRVLQNNNNNNGEDEEEADSIVASSLLAGMIFGQLIGGYLGDVLGKRKAILLVMILQISGSIGSACISTSSTGLNVLEQLAIWRFILGIGAGGVYPLAAVLAAESKGDDDDDSSDSIHLQNGGYSPTSSVDDDDDDENANHISFMASESSDEIASFRRIALTFSTQGIGFITVPLIAYILLQLRCNVDFIWRFLLGIGALPGFVVMFLRLRQAKRMRDKQAARCEANNLSDTIVDCSDENNTGENDVTEKSQMAESSGSVEMAPSSTDCSSSPPSSLVLNNSHDSQESQEPDNELALVDHSYIESDMEGAVNYNEPPRILNQSQSPSLWESVANEPDLFRKFAGTAGTWFLFDVLFYGNTLFEPLVLEAAFGSHAGNDGYSLLQTTVRDSLMISLLSLPGYFVTVAVIGKRTCGCCSKRSSVSPNRCGFPSCFPCYQTPTFIQMQGFLLMFILYLSIGLFWVKLASIQWLLLLLYAASFFFANYGPNTTTFLLPSVTYSKNCRSTLNGLSAAAGKLGALCGSAAFAPAAEELGESTVMIFCGCVSLLALVLTKFCVKGSK